MSRHTAGPWEAHEDAILCGDPDMAVGSVFPCDREKTTYGSGFTYGEVTKANARLIAAAPELLEAAEAAKAVIGRLTGRQATKQAQVAFEALVNATAKATGAQP